MYPISDLTTFCKKTTGDVPPKLVGASTTVVGSKMYLYGGRLVAERKMVTDIYKFDLDTFNWERIPQAPDSDFPQARYFHSADVWNGHLIIFGGMAFRPDSPNPDDLCVLNDVRLFDLSTRRWLPVADSSLDPAAPKARYAHLSSVAANCLFIIGGQDLSNVWLDNVHVFNLHTQTWGLRRDYPRHCGTYRSVAVSSNLIVRSPQDDIKPAMSTASTTTSKSSDNLVHLPYSAPPTEEHPSNIYLFSNYNFTNVQRELEVFKPAAGGDFTISDQSSSMTGTSFPPGLRFPAGAILGNHFIVAGTYLTQSVQSFSIWALDLVSMTWSRIDPGSALSSGSWFRSCLWPEANKFLVFGNSHGNLATDYNRRLLSWDDVACIDLEAFGIYQYPPSSMSVEDQEQGLSALDEKISSDFEIICEDGRKISCSRRILEERWPWFKQQRALFMQSVSRAIDVLPSSSHDVPLPDFPNISKEARPDPRLSPRSLNFSESYPVSLAFVQYLYTLSLVTQLQHAPPVLSQLLLLSSTYNLNRLELLVKHAMHRALTYATSVGIYGVSTLCNCRSLQIRALRVVMAYSQKRPSGRSSRDKDNGGNSSRGEGGTGGGASNGGSDISGAARPRGLSDASFINRVTTEAHNTGGGMMRGYSSGDNGFVVPESCADVVASLSANFSEFPGPYFTTDPCIIKHVSDYPRPTKEDEPPSTTTLVSLSSRTLSGTFSGALTTSKPQTQTLRPSSSSSSLSVLSSGLPQSSPAHPSTSSDSSILPVAEPRLLSRRPGSRNQVPYHLRISQISDIVDDNTNNPVSIYTDQELCAVAQMMSPLIADFPSHFREDQVGLALEGPEDHEVEAYIRRTKRSTYRPNRRNSDSESVGTSSRPTSVNRSSTYDDSEAEITSERFGERGFLTPSHASHTAFHLPSFSVGTYLDSDTPSLTSSASSFTSGLTRSHTPSMSPLSTPVTPSVSEFSTTNLSIIEELDGDQSDKQMDPVAEPLTFASPPLEQYADSDYDDDFDYGHTRPRRPNSSAGTVSIRSTSAGGSVQNRHNSYQEILRQSEKSPTSSIMSNSFMSETIITIKSGGSSFSRILPRGKAKHSESMTISPLQPPQVSVNRRMEVWDDIIQTRQSLASMSSESLRSRLSKSTSKSEEKKVKKDLQRAKRDQLAAQLKAKQLKKEAERENASLDLKRRAKQGAATWEEEGAMYNMRGLVL